MKTENDTQWKFFKLIAHYNLSKCVKAFDKNTILVTSLTNNPLNGREKTKTSHIHNLCYILFQFKKKTFKYHEGFVRELHDDWLWFVAYTRSSELETLGHE